MNTNEILEAIDRQITQFQQARELLAGAAADAPAVATTKQPAKKSAGKRRGRPKGSVNKKSVTVPPVAKKAARSPLSPEGRERIAAAQKARWAAQKASLPAKPAVKKIAKKAARKTVAVKRMPRAKSPAAPATER